MIEIDDRSYIKVKFNPEEIIDGEKTTKWNTGGAIYYTKNRYLSRDKIARNIGIKDGNGPYGHGIEYYSLEIPDQLRHIMNITHLSKEYLFCFREMAEYILHLYKHCEEIEISLNKKENYFCPMCHHRHATERERFFWYDDYRIGIPDEICSDCLSRFRDEWLKNKITKTISRKIADHFKYINIDRKELISLIKAYINIDVVNVAISNYKEKSREKNREFGRHRKESYRFRRGNGEGSDSSIGIDSEA